MESQTVIRGPAVPGKGKPAGAVASVFDAGRPAGATPAKRQVTRLDPAEVTIERGVPMPEARTGATSPWPQVYAKMKKGDMVRLTRRQAVSFMSWGKKAKASLAQRSIGTDLAGVWRTA